MKDRVGWTRDILADFADLWRHLDESPHAPRSAAHASAMVRAGCCEILEKGDQLVLSDAMAQAVLLLTMVREACLEHPEESEGNEREEAS